VTLMGFAKSSTHPTFFASYDQMIRTSEALN
jgi:hypothetical protein